jgi:hypothetical protein
MPNRWNFIVKLFDLKVSFISIDRVWIANGILNGQSTYNINCFSPIFNRVVLPVLNIRANSLFQIKCFF